MKDRIFILKREDSESGLPTYLKPSPVKVFPPISSSSGTLILRGRNTPRAVNSSSTAGVNGSAITIPLGCYHGENDKLHDYNQSIPPYLLENIIQPALSQDKMVVVLAEEWQTAEVIVRLHHLLSKHNLRDKAVLFWNANNTFGFDHINFKHLDRACTITTVSRYMKHIMWRMGLNPIVIPNGIPKSLLNRVDLSLASQLTEESQCRPRPSQDCPLGPG